MKNNTRVLKNKVGEIVYDKFESKVKGSILTDALHTKKIVDAADIAEEMPFVMMPLREQGILRTGERGTHLLHIFQPNLWAQDYAHEVGGLEKMSVSTAIERADSATEYVLATSPSVRETLKRTGKQDFDLFVSMRMAAMIESAYYTRLGGSAMPEQSRKKIDTALMRRALRNESMFKTIIRHAGVEETDGLALLQFADEIDLTDILRELVRLDPYFNRRAGQVKMYSEINSTESIKLGHTKTSAFIEELLIRVGRKHPALFKRIAKTVV